MSGYRPPRFSGLGAHVGGVSAWVLVSFLERTRFLDSIQKMDPEPRREMLQTYDALRAAGIYWSENNEGTMRVDPGPQAGSVEQDAADGAERWTSERVANALGVVPRRVGQLVAAGRLEGIKVGNMWLISAESVQDYQTAETIRRKAA
ncbi:hypothetical protein Arth_1352 [Arthrobacter sp. FB24]|nr:hypothetical protein Arth_1352 [Arthrobacter sp. FB24]